MNKKEALIKLAHANSLGKVSDLELSMACDIYKAKTGFEEDYLYQVYVAKSLSDSLNGVAKTDFVEKAILPGQTKVIRGVLHIYTKTPSGYDWRVYNGKKKIGRQVPSSQHAERSTYVNSLFPKSIGDVKEVKKLGGSTGAVLVEDASGTQYVMKKGSNTNADHVRSEYLATQLYSILGANTPEMELYEKDGEVYLLSKFIMGCKPPTSKDYDKMADNFVVDALLANWDVYQNDNCLVDPSGRVFRVDNGGSLDFRARGSKKTFDDKLKELENMLNYAPGIASKLTEERLLDQMNACLNVEEDVIEYLKVANRNDLADIMEKRFKTLKKKRDELDKNVQKYLSIQNAPRTLMSPDQMYRDLTEDELKEFWGDNKTSVNDKLFNKDKNGWHLLGEICRSRGFDGRPQIVDSKTYDTLVSDEQNYPYQLFRGQDSGGGKNGTHWINELKYGQNCFFGSIGIHGEGIYSHINDGQDKTRTGSGVRSTNAYRHAISYSDGSPGSVAEMVLDKDAKICHQSDIIKFLEGYAEDVTEEVVKAKEELSILKDELQALQDKLLSINSSIENDTKKNMHWDDNAFQNLAPLIDSVDWGDVDIDGNPVFPDFNTFVKGHFKSFVESCGGTCTEILKNVWEMKLPNSSEKFQITTGQWYKGGIKRPSQFGKAYHLQAKLFQRWMENNHFKPILNEIDRRIKEEAGDQSAAISAEIADKKTKVIDAGAKVDGLYKSVYSKNPDKSLYHAALSMYKTKGDQSPLGIVAAALGYDAMRITKDINHHGNSYMVIFNRSKLIIKR